MTCQGPPIALLVLLVAAGMAGASAECRAQTQDAPPASPDDLANRGQWSELVERLSDAKFDVRETANALLLEAGDQARAALDAGTRHSDREVRLRCLQTLLILDRYHLRSRLALFVTEYDPTKLYDFPGWVEAKSIFGDDESSRALFVEMQKREGRLLKAVPQDVGELGAILDERLKTIGASNYASELHVGASAAILLAETVLFTKSGASRWTAYMYRVVNQGGFRQEISGGKFKDPLRKLASEWILQSPANNYYHFMTALQLDLEAGLAAARSALHDRTPLQGMNVMYALANIAKFGTLEEDEALLTRLLEDRATVSTRTQLRGGGVAQRNANQRVEIQVRDVALAALVYLAKQSHADYGMPNLQIVQPYVLQPNYLGFDDEDERTLGLTKWREFRQVDPPSTKDRPPAPMPGDSPSDSK